MGGQLPPPPTPLALLASYVILLTLSDCATSTIRLSHFSVCAQAEVQLRLNHLSRGLECSVAETPGLECIGAESPGFECSGAEIPGWECSGN